ncbi:hypothetical protein GF357_00850 [Candidatus Dojkabacteria bacterium]|nr:hypothetical protein [Candidatus Dojkabacteria bacterium]
MSKREYLLTAEKLREFKKELQELKSVQRKKLDKALVESRNDNLGEFENPFSEISEAKFFLEKRISELEDIIANTRVIHEKHVPVIGVGSHVEIGFESFSKEFMIVDHLEANPIRGKISTESPVGKALLGARVGDEVEVDLGTIRKTYRVINIK